MQSMKVLMLLVCIALLSGCTSMFGRSTNDPAVKLRWASEDFSTRDEPVEAEKLIQEALKLYQKSGDRLGRAEAYRQYGLFLRSQAVMKSKQHYVTEGFLDETIRFADRYEKAIEYFMKSREIFAEHKKYDKLSNIDISLAKTYAQLGRSAESCDALAKGVEDYNAYKQANPEMKEYHAEEVSNYEEYLDMLKNQLSCTETDRKPARLPATAPTDTAAAPVTESAGTDEAPATAPTGTAP